MASELMAGATLLNSAFNLSKGLLEIRDGVKRDATVIELQNTIIAAQAAQMAAVKHVNSLEEEIASFKKWDTEKKKYELKESPSGFFCYHLKKEEQTVEPSHRICANCYEKSVKSILQTTFRNKESEHLKCHLCSSEFQLRWREGDSWASSQPIHLGWAG